MQTTIAKQTEKLGRSSGVTLAEVAAQAGVSAVAASVVLNGSTSGARVSEATRERIIQAANELHYSANVVARSLRKRQTDIIAFYNAQNTVFDPRAPFYAAILAGIQQGCEEQKKDLLTHSRFEGHSDDAIFLRLLNGQIDGLVLYARTVTPLIERLVASRLPVVTIVHDVPNVPSVGIDDARGGQLLAQHLLARGYKKILYRRTANQLPSTLQARFESFCATAEAGGITLLHSRCDNSEPSDLEREMLLAGPGQRPDAVACWNDYSADGIASFCVQHGLRVPQDIAIVGFDGLPPTSRPALDITTIRGPWADVARTAVAVLVAQSKGQEVPQRTTLPIELIEGSTT